MKNINFGLYFETLASLFHYLLFLLIFPVFLLTAAATARFDAVSSSTWKTKFLSCTNSWNSQRPNK